ncbi:hypothetical protein N7456_009108 [Penicillium angulare]|uniref:A-kinase anchor protein 7-like phosphoesterase domain-containing protein n=1 Tax=Penicillium angulare TaxID=116970 RepID=A0A9W9F4A3_9EURO|nr:hypothetical protein N7456_009108 [Penicillium angulare]
MTGHKSNAPRQHVRKPRPEKRPPLTHFLCIPLVNSDSLPQLEESVKTFRKDYPPIPVADLPRGQDPPSNDHVSQSLIPEGAIRPLGTLHLTLGVMSLPSQERLDQAINLLRSLDLASLMHEAERIAIQKRSRNHSQHHDSSKQPLSQVTMQPMTASLESLHALPNAKAATVLYAAPVDPTDRLYPFCLALRGKFLEAGFIVGEMEKPNKSDQHKKTDGQKAGSHGRSDTEPQAYSSRHPERESPNALQKPSQHGVAATCTPKLRPLLLHATIAKTTNLRGRPKPSQGPSHAPRDRNVQERIVIDAREALARYSDYHADGERAISHNHATSSSAPHSASSVPARPGPRPPRPFLWAKDIPLDSVSICEMSAKNLAVDGPDRRKNDWNKRLGGEYITVAQRSILGSSTNP